MPCTIYLARHGERLDFVNPDWPKTAENPHDAPLTERGVRQATDLGKHLSNCNIAHVFASPFSRVTNTAATASASLPKPLPVNIESGACEWLNGDWYPHAPHWCTVAELKQKFPLVDESYAPVFDHETTAATRFPEKREDMVERARDTASKLVEKYGGDGNILIVGHGSSVEAFYEPLVPKERRRALRVTYCSLTVCFPIGDGTYDAKIVGDTGHLVEPEPVEATRYI